MSVLTECNYTLPKCATYHRYDEIKFTGKIIILRIKNHWNIIILHNVLTAECDPANFAIRGVLIPILAIAGTIANIITIRVFNKQKMKTPILTTLTGRYS